MKENPKLLVVIDAMLAEAALAAWALSDSLRPQDIKQGQRLQAAANRLFDAAHPGKTEDAGRFIEAITKYKDSIPPYQKP